MIKTKNLFRLFCMLNRKTQFYSHFIVNVQRRNSNKT